jgi:hypothetical protein
MSQNSANTMGTLLRVRSRWQYLFIGTVLIVGGYFAVAIPTWNSKDTLGPSYLVSGYALLAIMVFLAAFNLRKRLAMLPLIRMRWWNFVHTCLGTVALAVFWLHTDSLWASGMYEQILAALVYLVSASGVCGVFLQRMSPSRLTQTGIEVIFERIPAELADLQQQAETLILECTRSTGHDTLARSYVESLQWFFFRPRFVASHIRGSQSAEFWLKQRFATVRRYLNHEEQAYLAQLERLAELKTALDAHYAGQLLLRSWLLIHVPCVATLLTLALWHVLLVHIYAL